MGRSGMVLLTGATGLLGSYLLRELLTNREPVAVLVRDARGRPARERVEELVAGLSERARRALTRPVVLAGDLRQPGLGLGPADRALLARHRPRVLHAAASIALRGSPDGEPWHTNVEGTQHLLDLCGALGLRELHHVSTAFVCGDSRRKTVREEELDCGQGFHNDYERSKCEAEKRVRAARALRATVYRPAVIVGDSQTGHTTTYHAFYRFLELADRLAGPGSRLPPDGPGPAAPALRGRHLPLRLPLSGDEPRNLVPVDWVARAIVQVADRPRWHGLTYHLAARKPTPVWLIKEVAEGILGLRGVVLAGPGPLPDPTALEEAFLRQVEEYGPYLHGDPVFDGRNRLAAGLGDPARVGRALLGRLIRFAQKDNWGRPRREGRRGGLDCTDYVERFFPEAVARSRLANVPLTLLVGLELRGPGGGSWSCRWQDGALVEVRRGLAPEAAVVYHLDRSTFEEVVRGRQSPQLAFFARTIEISGDVEKGLKLAVLFGQLVQEFPYQAGGREEMHAACR